MTECQHNQCTNDADGTVYWESGSVREYCSGHIANLQDDLGQFIQEVELV